MTKKTVILILLTTLFVPGFLFRKPLARGQGATSREQTFESATVSSERLPGLQQRATVVRDVYGVPHITASSDHDLYLLMGYVQAQDRFFQMDFARRQGSGALAELLGAGPNDGILGDDIKFRTIGVGRSAERSLSAYTPEALALIQAYSDGVNAWLDNNPLPPEYAALEITRVPRWRPVDSITIIKFLSAQLAFDVGDVNATVALSGYQAAGRAGGFDGARLYFEDVFRFTPFDTAVTIPGSAGAASPSSKESHSPGIQSQVIENARQAQELTHPDVMEAARKLVEQFDRNTLFNRNELGIGSNWWVVAGSKTDTGNAMLANDPHLSLGAPSILYEIHLTVDSQSSPMNVYGVSFSGVPGVFLGHNDRISWGATTCSLDITDLFVESLVIENGAPSATRFRGGTEPLVIIPEEFKTNQVQNGANDDVIVVNPGGRPSGVAVPPATLVVPRRNNGPIVLGGPASAISIQYVGASATRDLEGVFALARARNLTDFKRGVRLLESATLNWAYADVNGNIATFVGGKIPLREDLQAGTVDGLPPFFLRDGTGALRHEWIASADSGPGSGYESLPFDEMPQTVNPRQGFLVNANNDPVGLTFDNNPINQMRQQGIYYISSRFDPGFRAAKITELLTQQLNSNWGRGKVSFHDMQRIQNNVEMPDAEVFTPYIIRAFNAARGAGFPAELAALANDPAVNEAVGRLSKWDFSAPTGISKGYDSSDIFGLRRRPSEDEVSNSIAATIYTVWRSQVLANTIIATLQRVGLGDLQPGSDRELADLRLLLDNFSTNHGIGASGLDFFELPGVDASPEIRRDGIILKSLKGALNLLASDAFADAFNKSTNQNDYNWGKLHRITFGHLIGSLAPQFNIPTAGNFEDLSPALPGLATDGGFETIDNGSFDARGASSNAYVFGSGAARRYVGELRRQGVKSVQIIPGGESGVLGDRFYANQLPLWLTNDYHRVLFTNAEIHSQRCERIIFNPSN